MPENIIKNKTNKNTYHWSEVLHNEHACVFTIAKSTEADILQEKGWWGQRTTLDPVTKKKNTNHNWEVIED